MRGKNIDLNNFKRDVLSDVIEESRLNFEDTIDGKAGLSNAKQFSYEKVDSMVGQNLELLILKR